MMLKELVHRRKKLKSKLLSRQKVFGAWTSFGHPSITEIFCHAPFDFIGIDLEHSTISLEQAQGIVSAAQGAGSLCLPRIASHNPEMGRRLLDAGADGVIVPMVETLEETKRIIEWVKYPTVGKRSFGVSRAQGYGFDFGEYCKAWNASSSVIVQIESQTGVENIDSILACKSVDGVMAGPYDLSGSLGIPGQIEHKLVKEACRKVIAACKKHKKACGTHVIKPDLSAIKKSFASGFTFAILASDLFVLWNWSEQMNKCIATCRRGK